MDYKINTMTDEVQLIKQEIERRIDRFKGEIITSYTNGWIEAYEELLQFINSIPEEHNEDLEEEIQRAYYDKSLYDADNIDRADFNCIAHHFAEWQKQKDLEDLFKSDMTMPNKFYEKGKADAMKEMKETLQTEYEKGRFDMREELMEDAVEAIVSQVPCSNEIIFRNPASVQWFYLPSEMNKLGVEKGDKVKIIIVKTEQP